MEGGGGAGGSLSERFLGGRLAPADADLLRNDEASRCETAGAAVYSGAMKKSTKAVEARNAPSAGGEGMSAKTHTDLFARAVKSFSSGNYQEAAALFEQAADGPLMSVNESARMYRRMCLQRIESAAPKLQSPEDFYNYGVSLLNAGRHQEARGHLETAVSQSPLPHYLYALALAEGMLGSVAGAVERLRRAIEADPAIRALARNDADFAPLLQHASIRELLSGGSTS
jgi:tetratricopeptide (TPR) repeat protein